VFLIVPVELWERGYIGAFSEILDVVLPEEGGVVMGVGGEESVLN